MIFQCHKQHYCPSPSLTMKIPKTESREKYHLRTECLFNAVFSCFSKVLRTAIYGKCIHVNTNTRTPKEKKQKPNNISALKLLKLTILIRYLFYVKHIALDRAYINSRISSVSLI